MPSPTTEAIRGSLDQLKSGSPLFQNDISNIAWEFANQPEQEKLLRAVHPLNKKLAEVLLVFRDRLMKAAAESNLPEVIDQLFLHYVINTDGPIPEADGEDPFDVFDAATRYAKTLSVGVKKGNNDDSILEMNGKEEVCPSWGAVPGWSAAWSLRQVGPVINRLRYGRDDVIPPVAFDFDENAADHSLQNAMVLSDLAHVAYFKAPYIEQILKNRGYDSFKWIEDEKTDTQGFIAKKDNHVVVSFRGTSSKKDALIDLKFLKKIASFNDEGRVHRGFEKAVRNVWSEVKSTVQQIGAKKIFVCGHSLGAGLAILAAHRFAVESFPVGGVYVYGSPRVGTKKFRRNYNKRLGEITFLHINNKDVVATVPPPILNYRHVGTPPRLFDDGHGINFFDDVDKIEAEDIAKLLVQVNSSIEASTEFLNTPPQQFVGGSYSASFDTGMIDDHSIAQYLFKFGCAIIDKEWERINAAG